MAAGTMRRASVRTAGVASRSTRRRPFATIADAVEDHDIVVVGGGPVGLAFTSALAACDAVRGTHKISLLEAGDLGKLGRWKMPPGQYSNRISSVTNENIAFLKRIGAWDRIDLTRTNPLERMQVWDGLSSARITFDAYDTPDAFATEAGPSMARFVENLHLQRALIQTVEAQGGVELIGGQKVANVVREGGHGWPIVELEGGRRIRARLLVGADGFNSPVKKYSDISSTGWNYDAHCVVGNLECEPSGGNFTAYQRFLTTGPLAFLPINDTLASLAWSTKPAIASALKSLAPDELAAIINACFRLPHESVSYLLSLLATSTPPSTGSLLSEIEWRSSPSVHEPSAHAAESSVPPRILSARMDTVASFPLRMFHADSYLGPTVEGGLPGRTALIGDAAHVVHPMAGQGLNLGLGDASCLASTVERAALDGLDVGSPTALAPYPRKRYLANHAVMSTVDKLHKLYSLDAGPVVWARSVGVEVLQELPSVKAALMGGAGSSSEEGGPGARSGPARAAFGAAASAYETANKAREVAGVAAQVGLGYLRSVAARYLVK